MRVLGGTLRLSAGFTQTLGTAVVNHGILAVTGTFQMNGGTVSVSESGSEIQATGPFQQDGGSVVLDGGFGQLTAASVNLARGSLTLFGGILYAVGGVTIQPGATLYGGYGNIHGDVFNSGIFDMIQGSLLASLYITGNYTQAENATLRMGLNGRAAGANGQLTVSGNAYLAGTLTVEALNGTLPLQGDWFRLIHVGQFVGAFTTVLLPSVGSGHWLLAYNSPEGWLSITVI